MYWGLVDDEDEEEEGEKEERAAEVAGVAGVAASIDITQECYFPREWRFIHIFDYFASVYHYEFVSIV